MAKINPKTKSELDSMSKEQINDHRVKYLQQDIVIEKDAVRYYKEIELYTKIRFKDDELAKYQRWEDQLKDPNAFKHDKNFGEATKFLVDTINKMGKETFYNLTIESTQKELGEMQYIK